MYAGQPGRDRRVLPSTRWCKTSICFSRGSTLHIARFPFSGAPARMALWVAFWRKPVCDSPPVGIGVSDRGFFVVFHFSPLLLL